MTRARCGLCHSAFRFDPHPRGSCPGGSRASRSTWPAPLGLGAEGLALILGLLVTGPVAAEAQDHPHASPAFLDTTDPRVRDDRPAPTERQVESLRELEREVDRFATSGAGYRDSVTAIARHELLRERRTRHRFYDRQIATEEARQSEARLRAIRLFERFVAQYPDDPTYTPDAMFRLGELYFERSAIEQQLAFERAAATSSEAPDRPDFQPTVALYESLIARFPDYRRIDGVYYLVGYCLNEMGRSAEAVRAWQAVVCANRFSYGTPLENAPADLYADCTPIRPGADMLSETWFRIGEHHFDDYADPHALQRAITAYSRITSDPSDRNYGLAQYKLAWAYFRATRYPEAARAFGELVRWSDEQQRRTGRSGSELRPEAIQYLGIVFAYDDWNENEIVDSDEGERSGLDRIQDPQLLPQDASYTADVYYKLGDVYFDEAKYAEAIAVWELAIGRWPLHRRAPEITNEIARAYQRANMTREAVVARSRLGQYREGGEWYLANADHPRELRIAQQLADNALIGTAVHYHQQAQSERHRCVERRDVALCTQARATYNLAAAAYEGYLEAHRDNPDSYEVQFNLADAMYWSERYEEAAQAYAAVRDSNLDESHLSEAARLVVESLKRAIEREENAGRLVVRHDPPTPAGNPLAVAVIEVPELVQRLANAREVYLARVDARHDTEHVRDAYDYNNALLLLHYGYWDVARARLTRIFEQRCAPGGEENADLAWINLRNMANALEQTEEVARLGVEHGERRCTGEIALDCAQPENAMRAACVEQTDRATIVWQRANDVYHRAEAATGEEQVRLFEEAATMYVGAVNETPSHPMAPAALERAATALERASRFESAGRLYQRILDDVAPRRAENAAEQASFDAIVANAYFRLGINASRFFDYERAVESYRALVDSPRLARSSNAAIQVQRESALSNAAILLENLQDYDRAAEYYRRTAESASSPDMRREAAYRVAEMAFRQRDWTGTIRAMGEFVRRYDSDDAASELVVEARWRIAQAREHTGTQRERRAALEAVVSTYDRHPAPGTLAGERAAHAAFLLADQDRQSFDAFSISAGRARDVRSMAADVMRQVEVGAARAAEAAARYERIETYGAGVWTIAAQARRGRVYETLVRAMLDARVQQLPDDLARSLRGATPAEREQARVGLQDQIRQTLEGQAAPLECRAVARYVMAARLGRRAAVDGEHVQFATERLDAYGEERVIECVAEAHAENPTFAPYTPGELAPVARGQTLTADGEVPPSLDRER